METSIKNRLLFKDHRSNLPLLEEKIQRDSSRLCPILESINGLKNIINIGDADERL